LSIPSYAPKQRGEELKKIVRNVRDGTFEYDSKEPVKTDCAQYDQAQIYEMVNYLNNIRDLVDLADKRIKERTPPRKWGPGRPPTDVEEVFTNKPKVKKMHSGHFCGEDVYRVFGQTEAGRYLTVFFSHKRTNKALVLSARDMDEKERKSYSRK